MENLELRLNQADSFMEKSENTLKNNLVFLQKYFELYKEIIINYDESEEIYIKAQRLLYKALYNIVSEYDLQEEAEIFYSSYIEKSKM